MSKFGNITLDKFLSNSSMKPLVIIWWASPEPVRQIEEGFDIKVDCTVSSDTQRFTFEWNAFELNADLKAVALKIKTLSIKVCIPVKDCLGAKRLSIYLGTRYLQRIA